MTDEIIIVAIGSFFLFVAMPAIIALGSYHEKKLKLQRELAQSGGADLRAELAQTLAEMQRMNARMAVLERLITDDDRRVANEIDRLQREDARA